MHHSFLYISFPSLHNYDVKLSNFKVFFEDRNGKAINSTILSELRLGAVPSLQFQPKFPSFKLQSNLGKSRNGLKGCGVNFSVTFSWTSPLSNRKVPTIMEERHSETARWRLRDLMRICSHRVRCLFVQKRSIDIINITDLQPRGFIYCICNDTDEM